MGLGTTKKKTYTDMRFANLHDTDLSIRTVKKQLVYQTDTFKSFSEQFLRWKHDYRARYSEKFMINNGFAPTSDGNIIEFDDPAIFDYMQDIYPGITSVISKEISIPEIETQLRFFLHRDGYDWNNTTNTLIYEGTSYLLDFVSYLENSNPSVPDDETIIVGHFISDANEILELQFDNEFGMFVQELTNTTTYDYFSPITKLSTAISDSQSFIVTYKSIEDADDYFVHIEKNSEYLESVYNAKYISITPIITMKEEGELVPKEVSLRRMLKKHGLRYSDFDESLTEVDDDGEPAIDYAYLVNAMAVRNPYDIKPGVYSDIEAELFPTGLLVEIDRSINSEEYNEFIADIPKDITGSDYVLTPSVSEKWYNDHMNEQNYLARTLMRTFAIYANIFDYEPTEKMTTKYLGTCIKDTVKIDEDGNEIIEEVGTSNFTMSKFNMSLTYNIKVETLEGLVRPDISSSRAQGTIEYSGKLISHKDEEEHRTVTYTSDFDISNDPEVPTKIYVEDVLVLKTQISPTHYQVMTITNYKQKFTIAGRAFVNTLGSPMDENRIILPYIVMQKLRFTEYVTVYEHSFSMLAYAIKDVKVHWLERFGGFIISALICVLSYGTGCGLAVLIMKALIGFVVSYLLSMILEMIDNEILQLLVGIAFMMLGAYLSGIDFSLLTAENYLKLAAEVSGKIYMQHRAEQAKIDAEQAYHENIEEKIDERVENYVESQSISQKAIMTAHYSAMEMNSPEAFYSEAYGEILFSFDHFYDVDSQIELRKQVRSG